MVCLAVYHLPVYQLPVNHLPVYYLPVSHAYFSITLYYSKYAYIQSIGR